nr:hypothetical protein [Anaeromyxobacter dehalogenans]
MNEVALENRTQSECRKRACLPPPTVRLDVQSVKPLEPDAPNELRRSRNVSGQKINCAAESRRDPDVAPVERIEGCLDPALLLRRAETRDDYSRAQAIDQSLDLALLIGDGRLSEMRRNPFNDQAWKRETEAS